MLQEVVPGKDSPTSTALVITEQSAELSRFMPVMGIDTGLQRREVLVQAFKSLLKAGEDYGVIPGSKKPTLLQPGAQKLDNLFGLVPRYEVIDKVEDWIGNEHGGEPFFRYMIRCQVWRGDFIMGEGIGECNSWESKYRYRTADRLCPNCGKDTILFTKKDNWWCNKHKGGCGTGFSKIDERITSQQTGRKPNPEIFDAINTILKIGEKRAHLLATINATSASEFVTQDLEGRVDGADQQETATVANPGGSAQTGGAQAADAPPVSARPVPEELELAFKRISDKETGAIAQAFEFLEAELVSEYSKVDDGKKGLEIYNRTVTEWRTAHPGDKGKEITAIKGCLLDLWDALLVIRDTNSMKDSGVPTLDEMTQGKLA